MGTLQLPGYGLAVLLTLYGLLVLAMDADLTWSDRLYYVLDRTAWHNATARPPIILVFVLFGWSYVVARCRVAGMKLDLVLGPGPLLPARATFRSALVLLDVILLAHLMHFVLEPLAGHASPVYLACDVLIVVVVAALFFSPGGSSSTAVDDIGLSPKKIVDPAQKTGDPPLSSLKDGAESFDDDTLFFFSCSSATPRSGSSTDLQQLKRNGSASSNGSSSNLQLSGTTTTTSGGFLYPDARVGVIRALRDALSSPFAPVTFWHVIVADYATSLAKALGDLQITMCVVGAAMVSGDATILGVDQPAGRFAPGTTTGPNLSDTIFEKHKVECARSIANAVCLAVPFWCRLQQCLHCYFETRERKNLVNALKYCSAFPLVILGYIQKHSDPFDVALAARHRDMLILAAVVNSSFSFCWDVVMDWGLLKPNRRAIVFADRSGIPLILGYATLLAFNLATRFAWAVAVFSRPRAPASAQLFALEAVEVLRRTVWAVFRIEYEYISHGHPVHARRYKGHLVSETPRDDAVEASSSDLDHDPLLSKGGMIRVVQ